MNPRDARQGIPGPHAGGGRQDDQCCLVDRLTEIAALTNTFALPAHTPAHERGTQ